METVCEECGSRASFPAAQRGLVQQCPNAYVDVGSQEMPEDAEEEDDSNTEEP